MRPKAASRLLAAAPGFRGGQVDARVNERVVGVAVRVVVGALVDDGGGEGAPEVVGLGADEEQGLVAGVVDRRPQLDAGPGEPGGHAVVDVHRRAARPVVEQHVGVEGGHGVGVEPVEQHLGGGGGGVAGVDPALEDHDQHGLVHRRSVVQFVQRHRFRPPCG
jgi:hypothetical protein